MQDDNKIWRLKKLYICDLVDYFPYFTFIEIKSSEFNIMYQGNISQIPYFLRKSKINFMVVVKDTLSITI